MAANSGGGDGRDGGLAARRRLSGRAPDRAGPALDAVLAANAAAGLPAIDVSPLQGKLLHLLARINGARRILEIGTLGGYSTSGSPARCPTGGASSHLEAEPRHAEVARANIARAGLADRVEVRLGRRSTRCPSLDARRRSTWSSSTPTSETTPTTSPGRCGWRAPAPSSSATTSCAMARSRCRQRRPERRRHPRFIDLLAAEPRLPPPPCRRSGAKGWDGFAIAIVG